MLTGRPAFAADGTTATLALVARGELDFGLLPPTTPLAICTLLRHCLDREPRRRWPDAGSLRIAIEDARSVSSEVATPAGARGQRSWRRMIAPAFVALIAAALSALGVWSLVRPGPRPIARVLVDVSPASQIARTLNFPNARPFRSAIALSPDGQSLAFIGTAGSGARLLYVRQLDRFHATPVEGTDRAESPFFSPDGKWVGFGRLARIAGQLAVGDLKKVLVAGGPVVTVCRTALPAGLSWAPNGHIIFANHVGGGLWQVADSGGTPRPLTTPDLATGALSHRLPHVLPDGRAVLFTIQRSPGGWDDTQVAVLSLVTGEQKVLVENAADARYVASGHVVYARRARCWRSRST